MNGTYKLCWGESPKVWEAYGDSLVAALEATTQCARDNEISGILAINGTWDLGMEQYVITLIGD